MTVMGYKIWVIGGALLCMMGCTKLEHTTKEVAPLHVKTMVVTANSTNTVSHYVGSIEPAKEIPLSMQTTGRVLSVQVKNGDRVHQGQTLLCLDDTQARNALLTAEATLRHAQDGYDRVAKVHDKGVVSDQKMVEIESDLARAKALYAATKQQVDECTLVAPCDGIINGLSTEQGQTIIPGVKLCSVLDLSGFCVRFSVPESEVKTLGNTGYVECAAVDTILPVTVTERGTVANTVTHTYDVTARIEGGADVLLAGMVGKVTVNGERLAVRGEIIIPASCVLLKKEGYTVWVKENDQAVRRFITIGGYESDGIRVSEGLQQGDTLIIEGYQKLYIGCRVRE